MNNLAILGYSGHAFVVLDACKKLGMYINYYCDKEKAPFNPYDLEYIGDESSINFEWSRVDEFVSGIGDNFIRTKVAQLIAKNNKKVQTIIHPTAVINDFVTIGQGTFISSNAVINPLVTMGDDCIINTSAIVEHECLIERGVHISPGAVLAGNVQVGELSFIGANSVVRQGVKIGKNVTIGAGSVVLRDVSDGETWVGNPAKKIR